MAITEDQINSIVDKVVSQLGHSKIPTPSIPNAKEKSDTQKTIVVPNSEESLGCFSDIDSAIKAAEKAYWEYKSVSIETRNKIIAAIRTLCNEHILEIARLGVEETKMGRFEDKVKKNTVAINKTPGVEDLEPITFTGDHGLTLLERAPFGVIGAITPCTNPSETIICNGIGMIAGGNSVVFNTHPTAKKTSAFTVNLMNKAIISAGGPPNLLTTIANPTIESAQKLMKHPGIRLLVVTGGPAVVRTAMNSGKRVVAAGPGNPPVLVDDTADPDKAARDIVMSASMDNNIICVIEKEIIATKKIAGELKEALVRHGCVELTSYQTKRLEQLIVGQNGEPNKAWVGKDIQLILKQIDMEVDPSKRLAIMETGPDHPFAKLELLMPVIPLIRVDNVDEGMELAYKLEDGCFHTAVIHSKNIDHMHRMAVKMNTSIFVKNGPALAGLGLSGEGPASFTIASPTGEGVTTARHFTRTRRCVVSGHFRIV